MDLIIICGPPASGKMTVGQELQKITGYKLFHNHMSLELVNQFFDFGTTNFKNLDKKIRFDIFEEIAKSEINGLIFTMVWAFNEKEDEDYIDEIINVFRIRNPNTCFVELVCSLEERLIRNANENRLKHKPSKRDIEASNKRLLYHETKYRMQSLDGDVPAKSIYKIENTHLSANETAMKIVNHFQLNT
jgi:tRNA uridine 5-carbamoylmethylation protein Kti12